MQTRIVQQKLNLAFGEVEHLQKGFVTVRLNDPVVQARALWNPFQVERIAPARGRLIAVEVVIGDAFVGVRVHELARIVQFLGGIVKHGTRRTLHNHRH